METLKPFSVLFSSAFSFFVARLGMPDFSEARRRDENSSGKIWEGAADGPRWIRGCICNTACSSLARRGGGGTRLAAYMLEENRVMPSSRHVLIPCILLAIIDRSITKGGVSRRKGGGGENSDKAGAGGTPFSSHLYERLGGKLQAAFSFHCIRVCVLVGAGWQAPLEWRSAVQMPS